MPNYTTVLSREDLRNKLIELRKDYGNYFTKTKVFKHLKLDLLFYNKHLSENTSSLELIYCFENNVVGSFKCLHCNKPVKFQRTSYSKFCSHACCNKYQPKNAVYYSKNQLVLILTDLQNKSPKGWMRTFKFKKLIPLIIKHTKNFDKFDSNINERCYSLILNINDRETCLECSNYRIYSTGGRGEYLDHCSLECQYSSKVILDKMKSTCLKKYGVDHWFKTSIALYQREAKCLKYHNVKHHLQIPHVREKIKSTCLKKYGVNTFLKTEKFKQKVKEFYLKKYGVESFSQTAEFREQFKETSLKNWGYNHPMQNEKNFNKALTNRYKRKEFEFPSGRIEHVQGYEPQILTELVNHFDEDDIVCGSGLPVIWYEFEGKKHRYYPDIYIKSRNMIIEVKSTYTLSVELNKNLAKRQASLAGGFNFWFTVGV
jgi:hypothetical protein